MSHPDPLYGADPRAGLDCPCVRLGQGLDDPERQQIKLPGGRVATVEKSCVTCRGRGVCDPYRREGAKVDAVHAGINEMIAQEVAAK